MIRTLRPWLSTGELSFFPSHSVKGQIIRRTNDACYTNSFYKSEYCISSRVILRRNNFVYHRARLLSQTSKTRAFSSNAEVHDEYEEDETSIIDRCMNETEITNHNNKETKTPHCRTCTCADSDGKQDSEKQSLLVQDQTNKELELLDTSTTSLSPKKHQFAQTCHLQTPLFDPTTPLPPPLPNPTYSFKKRVLPTNLTAFTSKEGKQRFIRALTSEYAEAYYPLSQQFLNQSDPAYCGVTTLVVVLNALAMDPNVRWRGGWRWYGDENMLLERCCLEEERVRREGISIEMFGGLARCQGVKVVLKRPQTGDLDAAALRPIENDGNGIKASHYDGINEFRKDIIDAVRMPPMTENDGNNSEDTKSNSDGGYFLVTSFSRKSLQQTGDGHFSPIAAYDPDSDSCLVLDVARFKYAPYWVTVQELYNAMMPHDSMTDKSRGWILMYPPQSNLKQIKSRTLTVEEREGKRLATCVTTAGSGVPICPVEIIKKEYCANNISFGKVN